MTRELDLLLDEVRMNMEYDVYSRLHDEIMSMETDFEETLQLKQRIAELEIPKTCESCKYQGETDNNGWGICSNKNSWLSFGDVPSHGTCNVYELLESK